MRGKIHRGKFDNLIIRIFVDFYPRQSAKKSAQICGKSLLLPKAVDDKGAFPADLRRFFRRLAQIFFTH